MADIKIENLSFTYSGNSLPAISQVNMQINQGDFVLICGESGCGKSTLLKLMKKQLSPKGKIQGRVMYDDEDIMALDDRKSVCDIGYVMQNPDNQIVTDKVWHELAFGLESLGEDTQTIRRKIAEICGYFGIEQWYDKSTNELSGGQKQMVNLASVMVMSPTVLILDEPTSQLDPIAASEFIHMLYKLNYDLGITIILVEHRLEEVFSIAHKVCVMDSGKLLVFDTPKAVGKYLKNMSGGHKMQLGLPAAVRIFTGVESEKDCPLTVREGKDFLSQNFLPSSDIENRECFEYANKRPVIALGGVYFKYGSNSKDVLRGVDLNVYEGEILCLLGGNGAGKTTLLNVISGLYPAYRGKVKVLGKPIKEYKKNSLYREKISYLPQNPSLLFVENCVENELFEMCKIMGYDEKEASSKMQETISLLSIEHLLQSHPYDISGGESQKVALAKILLSNPKILLLDEPTKGLDSYFKNVLGDILRELKSQNRTIIIVTHDIEFAAENADRCAMFFGGEITSIGYPNKFFDGNNFYTTAANKMSRHMYRECITTKEVVKMCKMNKKSE